MKVWITHYALTQGIFEAEVNTTNNKDMVSETVPGNYMRYFYGQGNEWHFTRQEAVIRAEAMRLAKIATLKKSLAKFEKMKF